MKLKNYLLLLSITLISLSPSQTFAQSKIKGNKDVKIQQTDITDFHSLNIGNELELVLVKSTSPSVTIEADSNLHSAIMFQVRDSILDFEVTKDVRSSKEFKVVLRYTDALKSVSLKGDVDVMSESSIQVDELELILHDDAKIEADIVTDRFRLENNNDSSLKFSTNCKLKVEAKTATIDLKENSNNIVEINAEELNINSEGKSELDIEGFVYNVSINSTNSSVIEAKELLSNVTKVKLNEKAEAMVQTSDEVDIDLSGSSKLELYGNPKINIENFSGNAIIEKKEL